MPRAGGPRQEGGGDEREGVRGGGGGGVFFWFCSLLKKNNDEHTGERGGASVRARAWAGRRIREKGLHTHGRGGWPKGNDPLPFPLFQTPSPPSTHTHTAATGKATQAGGRRQPTAPIACPSPRSALAYIQKKTHTLIHTHTKKSGVRCREVERGFFLSLFPPGCFLWVNNKRSTSQARSLPISPTARPQSWKPRNRANPPIAADAAAPP